jgi:hypothetical protein
MEIVMAEKPEDAKGEKNQDRGLQLMIAKTLSGQKAEGWKTMPKEEKRTHIQMAKKILSRQEKYKEKAGAEEEVED